MSAFPPNPGPEETAAPRFAIGQDVHLKTGGPEMVVNQCTPGPDGGFIVNTIWAGAGGAEQHGTYLEGLLEARAVPLHRYKR
jgi:uncharacterized protein YodC (DUF2158 family)